MTGLKKLLSVLLSAAILCGNIGMVFAADSASSVPSGGGGGIDVSGFTYVVDNMQFWSGDTEIEAPSGSCEVSVDMIKRKQSNDRDKLIIAAYSDTDKLIGMYTVVHDIEFGKTSNIKVSVTVSESDVLGNVKAFVWDSFGGMRALSNTITRYNNGEIDPMLEYDEEQQTSFPDVSKDSNYAEAIEFLATLGVLKGNSNGYFNPTGSVNRAAAAAAISHMAGQDEEAYSLRGESIYTDTVPGDIFTGYLNLGFIEPISAGVIAPFDNITVGQFIKAVIKTLGYEEMAEVQGGWPVGYIKTANSIGLLSGIRSNNSDILIREELAMICFNAINVPIIKTVGYEYTSSGVLVPKKVLMNGENYNYYNSLLTEVFGIYSVEGFVVETDKSGSLKQGEVRFGIAKTERYENEAFGYDFFNNGHAVDSIEEVLNDYSRIINVNVGKTNAADYEGTYAKAMIKEEKGEYVLFRFIPSDLNKKVVFDASLYCSDENTDFDAATNPVNYLNIFSSDSATKPTKYSIKTNTTTGAPELTVYVNGEKVTGYPGRTAIKNYLASAVGDVTLVDTYKTDGYYDTLYLNRYTTVQVSTVLTSQNKIIFTNTSSEASLVLDPDDENLVYNIYLDGEKIELAELKEDDVLSIAYIGNNFANSTHYDIYVSREVVTGKLGGISTTDKTVTIGGTEYKFFNNPATLPLTSQDMGNEYKLYLDNFGRIFNYELKLNAGNYAVLDKAVDSTIDENLKLTMYTAEGESKTIILDGSKATIKVNGTAQTYSTSSSTAAQKKALLETDVKNRVYSAGTTRNSIETRIVKYKISNSTGRVIELDFITGTQSYGTYKSSTGAIGSAKIGDETKLIDATEYVVTGTYADLSTVTKALLVNEAEYNVYSYGTKIDDCHPFVLVTGASVEFPEPVEPEDSVVEGGYAVLDKAFDSTIDENLKLTMYTAEGESKTIVLDGSKATIKVNGTAQTYLGGTAAGKKAALETDVKDRVYTTGTTRGPIETRIVKYKISNSTGRVIELDFITGTQSYGTYKSSTGAIGSAKIGDETKLIDATEYVVTGTYADLSTVTKALLVNEAKYNVYSYGTKIDDCHPFVLVTGASVAFPEPVEPEDSVVEGGYAVLDKAFDSTIDENLKLTMYTAEGESKTIILDGSKATIKVDGTAQTYLGGTAAGKKVALETDVKDRVYTTGTTREPIETRIVKYKVSNSTGRVIELDFITGTQSYGTYKSSTGAIGSANIGDVTKIIDAVKYLSSGAYSDLDIATKAWFINNENYAVYSYGPKIDGYHPFVLVTAGVADYNSSTRFAVIADGVSDEQDEAGDPIYVIPALYFDAEAEDNTVAKRLIVSDEIERTQLDTLQVGDIIVFTTDAKGYIDGYSVIFDFSASTAATTPDIANYTDLVNTVIRNNHDTALFGSVVKLPTGSISTDWDSAWNSTKQEPIQLVFGPVVTSTSMSVGIAKINNMQTDLNHNEKDAANDGVYEIDLDSDTAVYEYDYSQSKKNRLNVSTAASIRPSIIVNNNNNEDVIDWSYADNKLNVNFAFALVVDGVAKDILVFNAK